MSKIKAIVVGVSNYYGRASNLLFCKNDIILMVESLQLGLKVKNKDIYTLGLNGNVYLNEFINELKNIENRINEDDTLIVYFSGHGGSSNEGHFLAFSDGELKTKELISFLERFKNKSKVIFLDCCYSGNFNIDTIKKLDINEELNEFEGKGYAVFSSSNSIQASYCHPKKPISLFTSFLCEAFVSKHLIKQGKIMLYDIYKTVFLYLEIWNLKNDIKQQPIFKANMGGTIFFKVEEYIPFRLEDFYEENKKYIIYKIEPAHSSGKKRYKVKIILKDILSLSEMEDISLEIIKKVKNKDIFDNEYEKTYLLRKTASDVFIFFGNDESDIINDNYILNSTWTNDKLKRDDSYIEGENSFVKNGIVFYAYPYYEKSKIFIEDNLSETKELLFQIKETLSKMISLAEDFIFQFNDYRNKIINEDVLFKRVNKISELIDKHYRESGALKFSPNEIHKWDSLCQVIFLNIHDFSLCYNQNSKNTRDENNRKICMETAIKRYYINLNLLKEEENTIENI